ncbi:hypothetical protein ACFQX7_39285 [Luedemannella flava]
MSVRLGVLGLLGFIALAPVLLAIHYSYGPVTRFRVARFARRQNLTITPDNGGTVIRYLATTRRWRAAGIVVGYLASITISALHHGFTISSIALFAGWFVGALAAEARVAHLRHGERRAASLTVRRPATYVGPVARAYLPVAAGLSALVALATAIVAASGRPVGLEGLWLFLLAATVVVLVGLAGRVVLRRPQPAAAPDVIAADDAVRSRSLHALGAAGGTLVLYCVMAQLAVLPTSGRAAEAITAINGLGVLVVPVLGYVLATLRGPDRPGSARPPAPSTEAVAR